MSFGDDPPSLRLFMFVIISLSSPTMESPGMAPWGQGCTALWVPRTTGLCNEMGPGAQGSGGSFPLTSPWQRARMQTETEMERVGNGEEERERMRVRIAWFWILDSSSSQSQAQPILPLLRMDLSQWRTLFFFFSSKLVKFGSDQSILMSTFFLS